MNQNLCIDYNTLMSNASNWISNSLESHWHALQWRHNERDGVSNHQRLGCLLNRLVRRRSKKPSKLLITGFVRGIHRWPVNSPHKGPVTRKMLPLDDVTIGHHVESSIDIEYHFYAKKLFYANWENVAIVLHRMKCIIVRLHYMYEKECTDF